MENKPKLSIGKRVEKSWQDTSIPAKFLIWLVPIMFTFGMTWVAFKDLPRKVYANASLSNLNRHKHDLADQDRIHMSKALFEMSSILKEIRDDQRAELNRMRSFRKDQRGGPRLR